MAKRDHSRAQSSDLSSRARPRFGQMKNRTQVKPVYGPAPPITIRLSNIKDLEGNQIVLAAG
jgi:hypothetical protein